MALDLLFLPVPPAQRQQALHRLVVKPPAQGLGRNAAHDGVGRHVLGHHGAGADDRAVADGHAGEDHRLIAHPYVVAEDDVPLVVPGAADVLCVQLPFVKENGKRIGGQGAQGVIGAGKQELRPAGNGAEFPDLQPVAVDGVMIEHIVFLKISGVVHEVVVHRVIPYLNICPGHHVL